MYRGWDELCFSSTETYTLPYAKMIVSGDSLCVVGSSNLVLCDKLEWWDGLGGGKEGTYTYLWLIHIDVW